MDWKLFLTVFVTVFLAELGDKTQLATLVFAAQSGRVWAVFLGSALALITSSFMGAFLGAYISGYLSPKWIKLIGGSLFIIIGLFMVFKH